MEGMGLEGCHRCHPCRGAVYFESLTGGVASLNHRLQAGKPLASRVGRLDMEAPKSSPKDIKNEIFPLKIKSLHLYKVYGTKSIIFRGARIP